LRKGSPRSYPWHMEALGCRHRGCYRLRGAWRMAARYSQARWSVKSSGRCINNRWVLTQSTFSLRTSLRRVGPLQLQGRQLYMSLSHGPWIRPALGPLTKEPARVRGSMVALQVLKGAHETTRRIWLHRASHITIETVITTIPTTVSLWTLHTSTNPANKPEWVRRGNLALSIKVRLFPSSKIPTWSSYKPWMISLEETVTVAAVVLTTLIKLTSELSLPRRLGKGARL
jgi:hypothetical protein